MSGRVVDIAVDPSDATHFYVAYASGGLWETKTNGQSFTPLFDHEAVMTIGAIAVDWHSGTIWIGTGEVNSSRSSYSGVGLYRSTDGGQKWEYRGLADSQHIGRIIIHPTEPNRLWVASLGPLYSEGGQEGVFQTADAGETWENVLSVPDAGAVDLVIHPKSPSILYAAMWQRDRKAWNFQGSGPGSGIYRSGDGGKTWRAITREGSGFPQGDGVGRIGLAIAMSGPSEQLYAFHDNQARRPLVGDNKKKKNDELTAESFEKMSREDFLALDSALVLTYMADNDFDEALTYSMVRQKVVNNEIRPAALFTYVQDANTALFDTPVIGAEVYLYDLDSETWTKTHDDYLDGVVYSYGYYFGTISVDPQDPHSVYIAGVPILHSPDAGKTWGGINGDNVHADHHKIWVNPSRSGHLINGNDGGINISYDNGETWTKCNSPEVGQFYTVAVDYEEPYNIYGGLQDNGVWKGPSTYEASNGWQQSGKYLYELLMWGDGMQVAIDTTDGTVYTGYQFGHYSRIDSAGREYFHPKHELGERPLRWNWQTPIHLSIHDNERLYMGSNKLHRSIDRATTWETISADLTHGGKKGNVPYGSLTSIHESPLEAGRLLVGSDDGRVHIKKNEQAEWKDISAGLPKGLWVTRVWCSAHEDNRLYVALNGYRYDDMTAYAYRSDDLGASWKQISEGLPDEPINVLKEDTSNPDLLYAGTDHGLYLSTDGGVKWSVLDTGLPSVAVHDLVVQEREEDLVIGTHGRSIYVADIAPLRFYAKVSEPIGIMPIDTIELRRGIGDRNWYAKNNHNGQTIDIMLWKKAAGTAQLQLLTPGGTLIWRAPVAADEVGLIRRDYNLAVGARTAPALEKEWKKLLDDKDFTLTAKDDELYYLPAGEYTLRLVMNGNGAEEKIVVE